MINQYQKIDNRNKNVEGEGEVWLSPESKKGEGEVSHPPESKIGDERKKQSFFSLFTIIICLQIVTKVSLKRENNITLKILSPKTTRK